MDMDNEKTLRCSEKEYERKGDEQNSNADGCGCGDGPGPGDQTGATYENRPLNLPIDVKPKMIKCLYLHWHSKAGCHRYSQWQPQP